MYLLISNFFSLNVRIYTLIFSMKLNCHSSNTQILIFTIYFIRRVIIHFYVKNFNTYFIPNFSSLTEFSTCWFLVHIICLLNFSICLLNVRIRYKFLVCVINFQYCVWIFSNMHFSSFLPVMWEGFWWDRAFLLKGSYSKKKTKIQKFGLRWVHIFLTY